MEKLFRCLESESYLKREETPPPSPPKSKPAEQPQSSGKNLDRRQSEDVRRKEVTNYYFEHWQLSVCVTGPQVDDDDRDFRRSKRHDSDGSGEEPKRPTAPITVGRGDSGFAGKKRRNEDGGNRYTNMNYSNLLNVAGMVEVRERGLRVLIECF